MADIAPFRGILYDPSRVEPSQVLAPPYDVINDEQRAALAAKSPYNAVRLILPEGDGDAKYQRSAGLLSTWLDDGILRQDDRPALYRYHQVFTHAELGADPVVRKGFIAAVRLHGYDENVILPHERTLRGPKEDRLKLMRATEAHLSQIFGLYSDPERRTDHAFEGVEAAAPSVEGTTDDGTVHRLWRVTEPEVIEAIQNFMAARSIYIADGHHRYETMLAIRDEARAKGVKSPSAPTEFATFFLANMEDPGLVVLPTHRLVHSLPSFSMDDLLARAGDHFHIKRVADGREDPAKLKQLLAKASARSPSFAVVTPGRRDAWMFSLETSADLPGPPSLTSLDVTIVHSLVIERLLGIDKAALEAQTHVDYVKDTAEALRRVASGKAQVGFIMHPTRVSQVRAVSDDRGVMPQKSTFFYPKIASCLVIRSIENT